MTDNSSNRGDGGTRGRSQGQREGQGSGGGRRRRGRRSRRRGPRKDSAAKPQTTQGGQRAKPDGDTKPETSGKDGSAKRGNRPESAKRSSKSRRGRSRRRGGRRDEASKPRDENATASSAEQAVGRGRGRSVPQKARPDERSAGRARGGNEQSGRSDGDEPARRPRSRRRRRKGSEEARPTSARASEAPRKRPRPLTDRDKGIETFERPENFEPVYLAPARVDPQQLRDDFPQYDWSASERVVNAVKVRFMQGGTHEIFEAGDEVFDRGDQVVVETDKGLQLGEVVVASVRCMRSPTRLSRVIRVVTPNDLRQETRNQSKEQHAFELCRKLAKEQGLQLKLIAVDYLHGGNRAIFYFAAEGRIDFRRLVRELAQQLRTRIEMRQVGVRDASRYVGGVGPCGQQLCCSSFLQRFAPVSIRMAKDQNLVLNPQKVSGVCGRLMCCLTYEQKGYESLRKGLPRVGKRVTLGDGSVAKVRDVDVLRRRLRVFLEDGSLTVVDADDVVVKKREGRQGQDEPRSRGARGAGSRPDDRVPGRPEKPQDVGVTPQSDDDAEKPRPER